MAGGLATRAFDRLDKRQFERERDQVRETGRQVRAEMEARVQRELERRRIPEVEDELRRRVMAELDRRQAGYGIDQAPEDTPGEVGGVGGGGTQGVPTSPMRSSNVRGYSYDRENGDLMVQFHKGGIYRYNSVPSGIFEEFAAGNHDATTNGENEYGKWWIGKNPSLGSAHWAYIRDNFDYEKVA